jgi:hypothetical protein
MKKTLISLITFLLLTATQINAQTYYVAKNGSDATVCSSATNPATPKLTITAGLACVGTATGAGANKVVEVGAGFYTDAIRNNLPSGLSWTAPFILRVKAGDIVINQAISESNIFLAGIGTPSMYTIIDGFILDGTNVSNNNITINGPRFIRLKNLDIRNTANWSGIYTGLTQNLEILNCKIHDGLYAPTGFGHGIYIEGDNNLVEGCEIYNVPAFGIHAYSSLNRPSGNIYRNNNVYNFGLQRETAVGILAGSNGSNNRIEGNKVSNGKGLKGDGGIGIDVNGTTGAIVTGNNVFSNSWYGINAQSTFGVSITNNAIYENGINLDTTDAVNPVIAGNTSIPPTTIPPIVVNSTTIITNRSFRIGPNRYSLTINIRPEDTIIINGIKR